MTSVDPTTHPIPDITAPKATDIVLGNHPELPPVGAESELLG